MTIKGLWSDNDRETRKNIVWDSNSNNVFLLREILEQFEGKTIKKIKITSITTYERYEQKLKPYYTVRLKFTDDTKFKFEIYLQQGVFVIKSADIKARGKNGN